VKVAAGTFLGGAKSRLLPASIPLRFFGAAVVFHLLAWLALIAGCDQVVGFAGGLGWPLAALHLVTLGVLAMTAIGASLQLLPVATRQPVGSRRTPAAIWWLYTPGVTLVALGMGLAQPRVLAVGAAAVTVALAAFAALLAGNLWHARGMPGVVAHGWAAVFALVALLASALLLAATWNGVPLVGQTTLRTLHVAFAAYGFMGMLALGLSYILVPMFALAAAPDERRQRASFLCAATALVLVVPASLGVAPRVLLTLAVMTGASAVALHLQLMQHALATGMRRELGRSFRLVRFAWGALVTSLVVALALALDAPVEHLGAWFGLVLVGGWLLSFLLGILQRILPFLASMHAGPGVRPPTPASLTFERPLAVHFACHLAALALLAAALALQNERLVLLAGLAGTVGAAAFALFYVVLLLRMTAAAKAVPVPAGT
jgi:hypothetical protein